MRKARVCRGGCVGRVGLACWFAMLAIMILAIYPAAGQSGGPYELTWGDIGSGASSGGGAYALDSAIGQPDAGAVSGGDYTLAGGFFASPGVLQQTLSPRVYLPTLQR